MKESHPIRTTPQDAADGIRKRVGKACDRCRLKKSKCDGLSPCSKCKVDNAICVFGERKKYHDKVYPKGYVEMLEKQQSQLVSGMQELYYCVEKAKAWEGPKLEETNGKPLTHDILAALNLLEPKSEGSQDMGTFAEDYQKFQSKLVAEGAGYVRRRGSFSSGSEHSQHGHIRSSSHHSTPVPPKPSPFMDNFSFSAAYSSPLSQSPAPQPRQQPKLPAQQCPQPAQAAQLQSPSFSKDPGLYAPEWAQALADRSDPSQQLRAGFLMQMPELDDNAMISLDMSQWDQSPAQYDAIFNEYTACFDPMFIGTMQNAGDVPQLDTVDLDFQQFIQPQEVMT